MAKLEPTVAKMKEKQLLIKEEISRSELEIKNINEKIQESEKLLNTVNLEEIELKESLKSMQVLCSNRPNMIA